jgi:hypothetical protein
MSDNFYDLFEFNQDMVPKKPNQVYQPRVYGFRVNEQSLYYQNREDERNNNTQKFETSSRSGRRSRRQQGGSGSRR